MIRRFSRNYQISTNTMAELTITGVKARQIYDSRGRPTLECDILTQQGQFRAAVPSGASTGIYEALELRDGIENEWLGKGVKTAVKNINTIIAPAIMGKSPLAQQEIVQHLRELVWIDVRH